MSAASPTYQMPAWSRASATAAPARLRAHSFHSWTARALPYFGPGGFGPSPKRYAACPSSHFTV